MKKLRLLILLGMFICSQTTSWSQVFAHPGATWMFHGSPFIGFCSGSYQKWEYVGDTIMGGFTVNKIAVTDKWNYAWDTTTFNTSHYNHYFRTSTDTVFAWNPTDMAWEELYNFSLGIGDSTQNPLRNFMLGACPFITPYQVKGVVVDVGTTVIAGQSLDYYTVRYLTHTDTTSDYQTYYERIITLDYWYPSDPFNCNATDACAPPVLQCYKDNGMMTDSLCADLTWFEILSVPEEPEQANFKIYPNPVSNVLVVENKSGDVIQYDILSVDGKLVVSSVPSPVNVSSLPSGIYFITNGSRSWFRKFIKS